MNQSSKTINALPIHFQRSNVLNAYRNGNYSGLPVAGYCEKKCIQCDVSTKKVSYN